MISRQGEENRPGGQEKAPLAIIGIGCRFPGGVTDAESFWGMLEEGRSGIVEVPENRWNRERFYHENAEIPGKMITKWGGFVENLEKFDAQFFGISPREALRMDPQQRWLLEVAWEALEDAGAQPREMRGSQTGVFVGIASNDYASIQMRNYAEVDVHTNSGSTLSIASNRISYLFDLKGPSVSVDTACSSALVAVNLACQAIWTGECDAALAGGVNAILTPDASIGFSKASMLSPSGQCFAFDARANGYVRGEGAGMILIKPLDEALADGNPVYAVIRAAVINQDGNTSSMTVPGVESQEEMLRQAYAQAGMKPSRVVYMEAHGTGTPVGDPIETNALGNVLCQGRPNGQECLIGSVKTNIGHLESGSGIAGLIKAALVLHKDMVPPNLNFEKPNPNIPFEALKLKVATKLQPLPHPDGQPPVTAVNSFGFGGTNAHIVLEAAPRPQKRVSKSKPRADRPFVLPISARADDALRAYADSYYDFLADDSLPLADVCYSAGAHKEQHELYRAVVIGKDHQELRKRLRAWTQGREDEGVVIGRPSGAVNSNVFVFTGQGAQWWAMGQQLLEREPLFRKVIEQIDRLLKPMAGWSLLQEMTRSEKDSKIDRTNIAQPAIFALQVALAELWKSWGIEPSKVIGHSVGEVAAAYCAGIYSLEDAVKVIYHRSRLQDTTGGHGRMVALGLTAEEARKTVKGHEEHVQVAVVNSPNLVTLAGDTEPLEAIVKELEDAGKFVRWLRIDYAFHTHQMDPIKDELLEVLADIKPRPARIPFISTVTGGLFMGEKLDGHYWWRNVREPVLFGPAMSGLIRGGEDLFLELGPHPALQSSITECLAELGKKGSIHHSLKRKTDESLQILSNLGSLHLHGVEIDWAAVSQSSGNFVRQPGYPWHYEHFWLESEEAAQYRLGGETHPLLGMKVPGPRPAWQFDLDPRYFSYLDDHRFWDSTVFPAAGYGEIGIAVSRVLFPDEPFVVEELETKKALFVSENKVPSVRVVFDEADKYFYIYSATGDKKDWELNAQGRLLKLSPSEPEPVDLEAVRERLVNHYDHETYYDEYAKAGYQFGPNFQHLKNVWYVTGESLAEIIPPELVAETAPDYHFHPAILDACFHGVKGAQDVPEDARAADHFYLPAAIRRVRLYRDKPPAKLWTHAKVLRDDGESVLSDIFVYDEEGHRVADILGFRVDRVEQKDSSAEDIESCFYQFHSEPCRLRGTGLKGPTRFAATGDIVKKVKEAVPEIYREHSIAAYVKEFSPRVEVAARQFIQNAFLKLGWKPKIGGHFTFDKFIRDLGIIEQHHRLTRAHLRTLEKAGWLRQIEEDTWEVTEMPTIADAEEDLRALGEEYPRFASESDLQLLTGPRLAEVLCGEEDPLMILFPKGASEPLERFYREAGDFPANNQLIALAVSKAMENLPHRRALRVLEVGAGTGSLTRAVLPSLHSDRTEYTFSDNGPAFIVEAKKQFADHSFIQYTIFDVEKDPAEQGIDPHGYDLILATNVVHATSDLKHTLANLQSCLAANGILMFLEVTNRLRPSFDNVFGLLKGWWQYTDTELRPHSALLERHEWERLLSECGYRDVTSFVSSPNEPESDQAVFIAVGPEVTEDQLREATAPEPESSDAEQEDQSEAEEEKPSTYLVFADGGGVAENLTTEILGAGGNVVRVKAGEAFVIHGPSEYAVAPDSKDDIKRLFEELAKSGTHPRFILHCWSLDHADSDDNLSLESLQNDQRTGVLSGLALAQAVDACEHGRAPHVYFITRGAQGVLEGEGPSRLASAPLTGLVRVANNEQPNTKWTLIDLDPKRPTTEMEDLGNELFLGDGELEVAHRDGRRYANRLHNVKADDLPPRTYNAVQKDGSILPYRLQIDKPGILTNLSLNETPRREPDADEIEVIVKAGGINFRDVMKALGMYPGNPVDLKWFGDDFSGTVVRVGKNVRDLNPGDDVVGMAPYCFRSYVTVNRHMVFRKPGHINFEEAATLPTVFLTSHYALNHLARMQQGEKILIHAGTGGVGQAAIQIAKNLHLEIFSTAGSPEKRRLLKDMGVHHVMDSRSLDFADEIMEITNGKGVDAVLNSLAGDFIPKNFSVLAPFGRFLEIGKIDIYNNSRIGLEPLRNNISYFVIDLAQHLEHQPEFVASMFSELAEKFFAEEYQPLPHKIFPISDVIEAFRYMAQGKHIGKNVLSFQVDEIPIGPCTEDENLFRPDASYLITGGAGGFGLELAKWMARQGARNLVLMSRSGPRDDDAKEDFEAMRAAGINVVDARADVTSREDVQKVLDQIQAELPPLRGVIHGAMVLDDEFLIELDNDRFNKVLNPKMLGAWNLHTLTLGLPLEHFISFSSFSAVMGAVKQSNYNAGNYFLDSLAAYRHSHGLPALTFNWGALSGAGFVERNEKTAQYLEMIGLKPFNMDETLRVFRRMLPLDPVEVAASRVDWNSIGRLSPMIAQANMFAPVARKHLEGEGGSSVRPRILSAAPEEQLRLVEDFIAEQVAGVFGTDVSKIDRHTPLTNLGLDSLMAIELMNRIEGELGITLPMGAVLNGPNLKELAVPVLNTLIESADGSEVGGAGAGHGGGAFSVPLEKSAEEVTEFPLTEGQRALWFLHQLAPESPAYNLVFSAKFRPLVDIELMKKAFLSLYERHPMLDVTFTAVNGQPVQRVHKGRTIDFREHDATHLTEQEIKSLLIEHANKPFDLENGPVVRLEMFRTRDDAHVTLLGMHHIVSDAWSVTLILNDLIESYFSLKAGKVPQYAPLEYRYHDFVTWEHKHLESEGGEKMLEFWKEKIEGAPMVLDLPTDRPRPPVQTFNGATHGFKLDETLTEQVVKLTNEENTTLFTTLLSGFEALIHRYCNQDDLLMGCPLAGRNQSELHGIVGYFINPVALRSRVDDDPTFAEFLQRNSEQVVGAIENQQYPMARLVDKLKVRRDPSRSPIFQVSFSMERIPGVDEQGIAVFLIGQGGHEFHVGDMSIETVDLTLRQAQFEITLVVEEAGGNIYGCWQYNRDLFEPETIADLNNLYAQVLREVAADPQQHISEINLLSKDEETKILETWNATATDYPEHKLLHQLVAAQAAQIPTAVAVRCGSQSLTFKELNRRANGLASKLRNEGIGPDKPVALLLDRSVDMVVGTLGILKAGGCYVPMDPDFPAFRIQQMLRNAAPSVLVSSGAELKTLPGGPWKTVDIDEVEPADTAPVVGDLTPSSLAYIIYTSGSTGTPKGVEIPHQAAVNFLHAMQKEPGLSKSDRLLAVTTLSFDISLLELYLPLLTGAQSIIATREEAKDGRRLATLLNQLDITAMQATPATWQLLLDAGWEGKANLRVFCGGEAMPRALANALVNSASEVWNLYGPTETTVWSTCERVFEGDGTVSIGRPIANTTVYILDHQLRPVPAGFVGDLYIGGAGLARGYHNRDDLTAENFIDIKLPNRKTERVYKTGDLARWTSDRQLECLGRSDFQVKLRGVRMELEDIESQIAAHPKVKQVVVVKRVDLPGGENLVAYYIPDGSADNLTPELRAHLANRLPDSMRPAFYQPLDEFPLTPNQKIDRNRLPAPSVDRSGLETEFVPPQTPSEQVLWDIFSKAFETEKIGIRDNFFEIGGDSLLAVRILLEVSSAFNRELPVQAFLRNPSIEQLARYLHHTSEEHAALEAPDGETAGGVSAGDLMESDHISIEIVERGAEQDVPHLDAVALSYIPDSFAALAGTSKEELIRDWFDGKPLLSNVYHLAQGKIGVVMLPCFELDLYKNGDTIKEAVIEALELSARMGAKTVSLTGVIPSATSHGRKILEWIEGRDDLPVITTGDATRTATIVKSMEGMLEAAGRNLSGELVAFVGLGSNGRGALELMLEVLPHPQDIILCDPTRKPKNSNRSAKISSPKADI
uniref:PKS/NRPS hybrid n=1 Tax=uncultured bacterium 12-5D TaxID=1497524 RepID=A0A059TYE0_9BACT|nr:PKS/NRPS hybrid [uncultured bacterium 12-5D]